MDDLDSVTCRWFGKELGTSALLIHRSKLLAVELVMSLAAAAGVTVIVKHMRNR